VKASMQSSDSKTNGSVKLAASICDLTKHYVLKSETVWALRGVSFDVPESDYIAIMGPSGSGKSTLLNLLGCLDRPTTGSFFLGDDDVASMSDDQLSFIRASRIGFVFQAYNLIAQLSVVENIEVPLYYTGRLNNESRKRSTDLARMVGLADRLDHRPTQLSATGNLDSVTTAEILALFQKLNDEGRTIIMVTHEDEVAAHAKRVIRLRDGEIQVDEPIQNRETFTAEQIQSYQR